MFWTTRLDGIIDELYPRMVEIRRYLHTHPEPSGQESQTTTWLENLFAREGLRVRRGPQGRGLMVDQPEPPACRCMAVRAEIDALWIQDAKAVEYRSQADGVMHACGHDGHTAAVVGVLLTMWRAEEAGVLPWPVRWRGIFQPEEETSRGARQLVEAGAIEGVDGIVAAHLDPSRPVGAVGVRAGIFTANCSEMAITIEGRGGHAARPHESIDPIAAAAQMISSIYLFVPRAVDSLEPVVVTIGRIAGGQNPNVIPERVFLHGTLRTLGGPILDRTRNHIRQLARGLAETSGTRITVEFGDGPPSVVNDADVTALVRQVGGDVVGAENVVEIDSPSMGGEDFAFYLQRVPGSMFRLGCSMTPGAAVPLHSPLFDFDERALRIGARILARAVVCGCRPTQASGSA